MAAALSCKQYTQKECERDGDRTIAVTLSSAVSSYSCMGSEQKERERVAVMETNLIAAVSLPLSGFFFFLQTSWNTSMNPRLGVAVIRALTMLQKLAICF